MSNTNSSNCLNVQKFYETLAKIIGDREGVEIKVVAIRKREHGDCMPERSATGTEGR